MVNGKVITAAAGLAVGIIGTKIFDSLTLPSRDEYQALVKREEKLTLAVQSSMQTMERSLMMFSNQEFLLLQLEKPEEAKKWEIDIREKGKIPPNANTVKGMQDEFLLYADDLNRQLKGLNIHFDGPFWGEFVDDSEN